MRNLISKLLELFTLLALATAIGCASADKKADTPEGAYEIAQDFEKNDRFEEAIRRFQEIKNKFPYSKYALLAELAIADVYFKQESYPEAQVSYQGFKDLHPKNAQADYVTFRIALSYFMQLPDTVDRDLTLATNAISVFEDVIREYPNSQYAAEAKEKRDKCIHMLAEKEEYIADFYFHREKYDSALTRYEGLLKKYPGLGFDAKALSYAAVAANRNGEQDKAKKYISELQQRFPKSSDEIELAKKEVH